MNKILFINACLRDESRTLKIAESVISNIINTNVVIKRLDLYKENICPLNKSNLLLRDAAMISNDYSDDYFNYAKEFRNADEIIIAAPYWDLSFPAILKTYLENICITGLTFMYGEDGKVISLCNAKRLIYVTTAGGYVTEQSYGYIKALCDTFYGIQKVDVIKAECLDMDGVNIQEKLDNAKKEIDKLVL